MPIVQYRYKGRLISHQKASRIGNLPAASKYLTTYYREKYRGPSLYKGEGYQHGWGLRTAVALTKDRLEREERIERRAEYERRGRERETERRLEYEKRRMETPYEDFGPPPSRYEGDEPEDFGAPDVPAWPTERYDEEYEEDLELFGGPIEDWEYDEIEDYLDEWDVADIDDEDKYGTAQT